MKRVGIHLFGFAWLVILGPVSSASADPTKLPCDRYADDGGPCVAAHSTVRLLRSAYTGPLYQVRREGPTIDGTTKDIGVVSGGFADVVAQAKFCGTRICTTSIIYDQSGNGNDLTKASADNGEANAKAGQITISGHNLHGERNDPSVSYRNNNAKGVATGDNPETIYMVASGRYYNGDKGECCFEYGNVYPTRGWEPAGTQEAIYFGKYASTTCGNRGDDSGGPWVMADLGGAQGCGLWAGDTAVAHKDPSVTYKYLTAIVKGGSANTSNLNRGRLVVKIGNAQSDRLTLVYDGPRETDSSEDWRVMRKGMVKDNSTVQVGITLGADGAGNSRGAGIFYEGVMTAQCSSDSADDDVQANIVSVYGH